MEKFKNMRMHKSRFFIITVFVLLAVLLLTFIVYNNFMDISNTFIIDRSNTVQDSSNAGKKTIYIGVISRYPPNIIYQGYQPLMDYLTLNTKYHFELKLSSNYNESVEKLIKKEVSASFLGSYLYVKAHEQYGVIPILKPLNENNEPFFRSVVITKSDNKIYTIKDMAGKSLALPSKESFSGNWLTKIELKKYGLKEKDLKEIKNFPHHQTVLYQVLKGNYDAGVVREYLLKDYVSNGIRIIAYSDKIPSSPLVVMPDYNPEVVKSIRETLLNINKNKENLSKAMKNWDKEFIFGFTEASDSDYNLIRELIKEGFVQ